MVFVTVAVVVVAMVAVGGRGTLRMGSIAKDINPSLGKRARHGSVQRTTTCIQPGKNKVKTKERKDEAVERGEVG